jgi:putative membrane protein
MTYSGEIRNFIHPKMVKYSIFATIAIAIMLVYNLMQLFTFEQSRSLKYGYILFLIPVVIYMFLKPSGLSESTAVNRGVNLMFYKALNIEEEHHDHNHSHSHGDGKMLVENNSIVFNNENFFTSIKEIYGHLEDYGNRSVIIKGFAVREKNNNNSFILSRMVVSCCAADTEVIGIRCVSNYAKSIKGGQWVEVRGKFKQDNASVPPVLVVEKVKVIERPEESYIYRD